MEQRSKKNLKLTEKEIQVLMFVKEMESEKKYYTNTNLCEITNISRWGAYKLLERLEKKHIIYKQPNYAINPVYMEQILTQANQPRDKKNL